jgi:hypothetical protein
LIPAKFERLGLEVADRHVDPGEVCVRELFATVLTASVIRNPTPMIRS